MLTLNIGPTSFQIRDTIGAYAVAWCPKDARFFILERGDVVGEWRVIGEPEGYRTRADAAGEATLMAYPPAPSDRLGSIESADLAGAAQQSF